MPLFDLEKFKIEPQKYSMGWLGTEIARQHWQFLKHKFVPFTIRTYKDYTAGVAKRMLLNEVARKVLGKDIGEGPQEIGDCVSWGMKHALEYLQTSMMLMNGERLTYKQIFSPYLYGTSRVLIGKGQMDGNDGSTGAWMAAAVLQFGAIAIDEEGLPQYSGRVAKKWGDTPGPPNKYIEIGKKHLVRSAAKINSWDELCQAISNGYPCTVASNQGFSMSPGSDGFHAPQGHWAHQMMIFGYDNEYNRPYGMMQNSWGDAMGVLKDFYTGERMPAGCIRADKRVIENMIRDGDECYAISGYNGFPAQDLARELFNFIR